MHETKRTPMNSTWSRGHGRARGLVVAGLAIGLGVCAAPSRAAAAPTPGESAGAPLGQPRTEGPRDDRPAITEEVAARRATGLLIGASGAFGLGVGLELASAYVTARRCIDPVMLNADIAPEGRADAISGCKGETGGVFALQASAGSSLLGAIGLAGAGGWYLGLQHAGAIDDPARAAYRRRVTIGLGGFSLGLGALTLGTAVAAIPNGWPSCSEAECFNGRTRAVLMSTAAAAGLGALGAGLLTYGLALRHPRRGDARMTAQIVPNLSPRAAGLTLAGRF